jgi:hypothetical protein
MLTPSKSLNLDASVLRISALILRELQKRGVLEFERLRSIILRRVGPDAEPVFLPALTFVFLLGKLEYHIKNDTLEFRAD